MAPNKRMLLKGDLNRIYDEKIRNRRRREQSGPKEKFFVRPTRQRKMKNAKWFAAGMGIDLPFCMGIFGQGTTLREMTEKDG